MCKITPKDWKVFKVNDILTFSTAPSKSKFREENGRYLIMDMGAISKTGKNISYKRTNLNENILDAGDLVMPKDDIGGGFIIGKTAFIDEANKYVLGDHVYLLKINKKVCDPLFVHYKFNSHAYNRKLKRLVTGSAQLGITSKNIMQEKFIAPPLKEQQKIASILSSVDEAIEKTNQIIEQTEKIKYSIVQKLLTKGIKNNYFKSTSYGEIPTNWDIKSLDEISEHIFVGIATSTTNSYADKGVPIIRNQNIQENWLDTENMLYINEEFSEKNKKKKLKSGDVLTVRTGYPGITCVVPDKYQGAHTFTTLVSRPIQSIINPYFLSWFINSQVGKKFVDSGKAGGAQQNLNVSTLKKMSIFVPPLTEQNSIVRRLNSIEDKINNEKKHNDKLKSLKQGLMQQLLTGKVRVPTTESEEVPQ